MNSLPTKSNGKVNARRTIYIYLLIIIVSTFCAGCVGLTRAEKKKGSGSGSTPPTVSITAPSPGATVSGTVTVTTSVSSNTTSVQFKVDGNNTAAPVTAAPFDYSLDTTKLSNGAHSITAVASDAAAQTATSGAVSITVNNSSAPTVSITSPASGATVSGTVPITVSVSSNTTSVQFKVDGNNSDAAVNSAPFSLSLNTTTLSNGSHSLSAVASNSAGQSTISAAVTVIVSNSGHPTIAITSPLSGATVSGTVSVLTSVSSNTTSVQFKVDGNNSGAAVTSAPFSLSLNTMSLSNGSHSLSAVASNSAGQTTISAIVVVTVANAGAPTISITSPLSGATVSGTVSVLTSVSSNTTSVQLKVDGNNSGAAVISAPFSLSLNATTLPNGSHSLSAVASNSAGQSTISAAVAVTVSNTTLPTISINSPLSGATVSGTIAVLTSVSSNTTSVQFKVDGNNSGAAVSSAPFSLSLNTTTLSNGSHSLSALASNSAGQSTSSAAVTVTVSNGAAPTIAITSPVSGATVSGTVSVLTSVSSNTTKVQFKVDGNNSGAAVTSAPFTLSLNTTSLSNGSHSLSAAASNSAGQTTTSATVTVTVSTSNTDKTPPVVSITSPSSGATASGTVSVSANASDNVGVAKVEFYLDNSLQATDTASPYAWSWNTASSTNGSHTVLAKAYDAAGNTASASVTVTVSNSGTGGGGGNLTPSGPITSSGQNGVTIENLHITNPNGDCVTITNGTNITIRQSEIGPCKGNGIVISGGSTINVSDNYIHPEGALSGCCDVTDGIFATGTSNLAIQGNVIAYGESNIEAQNQTNLSVVGNFFLNPRGGGNSRGQNVQVWSNSTTVLVQNNYTLSSTDTSKFAFAEVQEDSINFGSNITGVTAQGNYITGGHSNSGCGLIADTGALTEQFRGNTLLNTGQCGIGITDGTNVVVDSNKILNTTPVSGGGNTAIYVWKVNASDPPCGPVQVSNNIASAIQSDGTPNSFWNGGGCEPVTLTNNTLDAAAVSALSPASQKLPPPLIPPQPKNCVIASPFSNNTSVPACGGSVSGPPSGSPTISISSPASGATVSGTISVATSVSSNTTTVQFKIDGNNSGAAVTSAPFSLSLNTATLANGSHSLTAVASNSVAQTTTSGAVAIIVNNSHLSIATTSFPSGQLQVSYSASLQATGGTAPYTWSVLSGQLPTSLSLSSSAGTISGTPTVAGSFSFTIQVKDSIGATTSAGFSVNIATPPPPSTAPFGHVFLVALENTNYTDVIGSSSMPYLNGLANQYGLATQYYADTHPSIGNYFMWTTGQIITNDDTKVPQTFPISADNAVHELIAAGKSWKQYAESIPSVGYLGDDSTCCGGQYYAHHAPLPYMADAQAAGQVTKIVPFTQFATDLAANNIPNYSFITPNGCNDAHDCGLDVADNWLQTNIDPLIKSAQFQKDGLLVIAFDESGSDNTNGGGRVVAVIISPFAKAGFKSTTLYQHESVLRLMLEGLGVKVLPGAAATAPKMWEFFTFTPPT
jgi:hypothetical protein